MQSCDASFKKTIYMRIMTSFAENGFNRFRKDQIDWPFNPDFHCWVGINAALYPDVIEINPNIGVHAPKIHKIYTQLEGRKYDRGVATYPVILGDIKSVANEMAFAFAPDQSEDFVCSEINRLVQLYAQFGLPYALSIASYEALLPLLETRISQLGGYPERYACCLYLMGRNQEAYDFCIGFLKKNEPSFEAFGKNFLEMIRENLN
jgi:hypothetical protein